MRKPDSRLTRKSDYAFWTFVMLGAGALLLGVASAAVWTYGRSQLSEQGADSTWSTFSRRSVDRPG